MWKEDDKCVLKTLIKYRPKLFHNTIQVVTFQKYLSKKQPGLTCVAGDIFCTLAALQGIEKDGWKF